MSTDVDVKSRLVLKLVWVDLYRCTYEEVVKKIESNGMVDILNNTYTTVVNKTKHLKVEEFNNQLHFSREQLDIC